MKTYFVIYNYLLLLFKLLDYYSKLLIIIYHRSDNYNVLIRRCGYDERIFCCCCCCCCNYYYRENIFEKMISMINRFQEGITKCRSQKFYCTKIKRFLGMKIGFLIRDNDGTFEREGFGFRVGEGECPIVGRKTDGNL